jgi:hypothetical protein
VRPLAPEEIVEREPYEAARGEYRSRVIALKRGRRVGVGDRVTLVFENRETLRFQVQEMLRVERIDDPEAIQAELDVYNELMPSQGELSATLFIEITESSRIQPELEKLLGLDAHVALVLDEGPRETALYAQFDPRQRESERISAVQYLRFHLTPEASARLRDPEVRARLRIDHPNYRHEAEISGPLRAQLVSDLTGEDPEPLLEGVARSASRAPECVFETNAVRVLRFPPGPGVLIECRPPVSFGEADPGLLAEILPVVQHYVRQIVHETGACRVSCEVEKAGAPMRWQLSPKGRSQP